MKTRITAFHTKPRRPLARSSKKKVKKTPRVLLPSVSTTRTKADNLLTPIIKLMHPLCLLCNHPTEVAHHHVHKSKSTRLRYELDNLIPLCQRCHQRLHYNESYWASKIVEVKGVAWFQALSKLGEEIVKADIHFYLSNYTRLQTIKDELDSMN